MDFLGIAILGHYTYEELGSIGFLIQYAIEINTSVSLNTFLTIFSELVYQKSNKITTVVRTSEYQYSELLKVRKSHKFRFTLSNGLYISTYLTLSIIVGWYLSARLMC